jgi:hypothetical protein
MRERGFPETPWTNGWDRWYKIFNGTDPDANITPYLSQFKVIVIKSCYPSSDIASIGSAADTLDISKKTIYNYKFLWRKIVHLMSLNKNNFFVIWTNAPLVTTATTVEKAGYSDRFCRWAKDTLATGLDPV